MDSFLKILIIISSIVCVGMILLQTPKGGSWLSAGSNSVFGSASATNLLFKVTFGAMVLIMVTSIYLSRKSFTGGSSVIGDDVQQLKQEAEELAPSTSGAAPVEELKNTETKTENSK